MRLPSKSATFWILIAVSAVTAFVLPSSWTTWVRGVFGPLALPQRLVSWGARGSAEAVGSLASPTISQDQARELQRENEVLKRQVAQQRMRLGVVEQRLADLTGLSGQLPDSHVRVVIAPIVACDRTASRATLRLTLSERQSRLVRKDQWVVAAEAPRPDWDAQATVRDLLDREWLVGRVSEVHPRVADVQLTTDPRFRTEVRAARVLVDGTWQLAEEGCVLVGVGHGKMRISQSVKDYGKTDFGIVVVPPSRDLAIPLSVGRIESSAPRSDSARHFDLTVTPWERFERLTHVYILAEEE